MRSIGGNTLDSAFIYCGGESEQAIGRWLKETGKRAEINILTKGTHHDATGPRVNPSAIDFDLNTSLERLGVAYVEMYALHRDDPQVPVGPILEALNEHIEAGKISTMTIASASSTTTITGNGCAEQKSLPRNMAQLRFRSP